MFFLIRWLLFLFKPEIAHKIALESLQLLAKIGKCGLIIKAPVTVMGLNFDNPVGLAAGLDKNGDYIAGLHLLGFGFLEIGTVTPRPQLGNPKPRLFRLTAQKALINRLGLNNKGVDHLIKRLKKLKYSGILGISISQNNDTPADKTLADYLNCYQKVYPYAGYIALDVSCPNVSATRGELLAPLLAILTQEKIKLTAIYQKRVPLVVKISPDLDEVALQYVAKQLLIYQVDGVIATNTTRSRTGVEASPWALESGGLSGQPLFRLTLATIIRLKILLGENIPIIATGGIDNAEQIFLLQQAGVSLIQIYTSLIYKGPKIIKTLVNAFKHSRVS